MRFRINKTPSVLTFWGHCAYAAAGPNQAQRICALSVLYYPKEYKVTAEQAVKR